MEWEGVEELENVNYEEFGNIQSAEAVHQFCGPNLSKLIKQRVDKGEGKSAFESWDLFFCWVLPGAKQTTTCSLFVLGILSVLCCFELGPYLYLLHLVP